MTLLGGIHLLAVASAQQHRLDLTVEELSRLRIAGVQSVVVDQKRLVLEPVGPALGTNRLQDTFPYVASKRGLGQLRFVCSAALALDGLHAGFTLFGWTDSVSNIQRLRLPAE